MLKLTDIQTEQILNAANKFIKHLRNVPDLTPDEKKELITECLITLIKISYIINGWI